jgi:hypothetical protein
MSSSPVFCPAGVFTRIAARPSPIPMMRVSAIGTPVIATWQVRSAAPPFFLQFRRNIPTSPGVDVPVGVSHYVEIWMNPAVGTSFLAT